MGPAGCWIGVGLIGAGCSFGLIPVYKNILLYAQHTISEEKETATSALFTVVFSIGSFLGPTLGGMLSQAVGIRTAYTYSAVSLVSLAFLLVFLGVTPAFWRRSVSADTR